MANRPERAWLDKLDGKTIYKTFPDQRFYSKEYTGEHKDAVIALSTYFDEYIAWCRQAFTALNQGLEAPAFPGRLVQLVKPPTMESVGTTSKEVKSGKTQAHTDETEG